MRFPVALISLVLGAGLTSHGTAQALTPIPPTNTTRIALASANWHRRHPHNWPAPPTQGFWVTETITQPLLKTMVHFYDDDRQFLKTDSLPGRDPNLHRQSTLKKLNRILAVVLSQRAAGQLARKPIATGNSEPSGNQPPGIFINRRCQTVAMFGRAGG